MRQCGLATSLMLLCASAFGEEYTLDVRNGACERLNAVVSQPVTREWVRLFETQTLAEVADGKTVPVPCGLDASGQRPSLVWLLSGTTAPGAVRRFTLVPKGGAVGFAGDLNVTSNASSIAIGIVTWDVNFPGNAGQFDITNLTGPNSSGDATFPVGAVAKSFAGQSSSLPTSPEIQK